MLMSNSGRPGARLHYMANGFRVLDARRSCRLRGERRAIPLELLRYWSVARQEPYASAEIAMQAMRG
jgi:hypothetical protein